jgi:hypothetical protein
MQSVVDGMQLGDRVCVDLSIEYINDNVMHLTTGYIRARMARALRQVELSKSQKGLLARVFLRQLESEKIYQEFKEYIRLFKTIGVESYRDEFEKQLKSDKKYIVRAANKLLY